MSETTVICDECGEYVPKKKFCFECGAPLALSVNQPPTSRADTASTPVQVSSVWLEVSGSANGQSTDFGNTKQRMSSSTTISRSPNAKTNGTPSSYAEAAAVRSHPSDKESQQNNQAGRVPNNGPADPPGIAANVSVSVSNNDCIVATNVTGGTNGRYN